jgi:hypothetical protein
MLTIAELVRLEAAQLHIERETTEPDPDLWRWSPLEIPKFRQMLAVAADLVPGRASFAEAGSGIGTKLYLAQHYFGMEATGYEISEDYIAKAGQLGVDTVQCDLRKETPPWGEYDIVYIARPFKDDAEESAWESAVLAAMRPGAVLVSAYAAVKPYQWKCYLRGPFRGVWVKPESRPPLFDDPLMKDYPASLPG